MTVAWQPSAGRIDGDEDRHVELETRKNRTA